MNVKQWLENMEAEHCDVDPGNGDSVLWGASDRPVTTGLRQWLALIRDSKPRRPNLTCSVFSCGSLAGNYGHRGCAAHCPRRVGQIVYYDKICNWLDLQVACASERLSV